MTVPDKRPHLSTCVFTNSTCAPAKSGIQAVLQSKEQVRQVPTKSPTIVPPDLFAENVPRAMRNKQVRSVPKKAVPRVQKQKPVVQKREKDVLVGKRARPAEMQLRHVLNKTPIDKAKGKTVCPKSSSPNIPKKEKKSGRQNRSLMRPAAWMELHPFAKTLHQWEKGIPVDCGADWSRDTINLAIQKGPHTHARTPESISLIVEDVAFQVNAGFSHIITWDSIKDNPPAKLKVSPLAVVPQLNRKKGSRTLGPVVQVSVNDTSTTLAPTWPVNELGKVLLRLLDFMREVPANESIRFAKIGLSNGFWHMIVPEADCWHFTYVLPDVPGAPIRLVIPHALQVPGSLALRPKRFEIQSKFS
eukprot:scaffold291972_cov60-Attheya_sp.AAC.1